MIRRVLLVFNVLVFTPIFAILIIIVGTFDNQKLRTGYLSNLWARCILFFSLINFEAIGLNNINDKKKYVFISNHQSALDILITFAAIPRPIAFFTKKELFFIPIFGWGMKAAGMIAVDRHNKDKSKESVDEGILKIKNTKLSILNYPEGTRTKYNSLKKFKKGGFIMAIKSNYPIIPLTILYSKKDMINSQIRLVVDNAIDTVTYDMQDRDKLINNVKVIIKSNLN